MNRWLIVLVLIVLGIIVASFWLPIPYFSHRTEIRAAIDIGSGATNLKVAKVDLNTDKIIAKIYEQSIAVPYQKHLEISPNNTFDRDVMDQGIKAIKALKAIADSYHAKRVVAVATAAFRKADNAREFAKEVEQQTGVKIYIIDQDEEGILAFRGALAMIPDVRPQDIVTWDIGGGSMQLTTLTDQGTYLVEKGKTASIPFKNAIIRGIKHQNIQTIPSPNPLNAQEMQQAIHYAERLARQTNDYVKDKLNRPTTQVLGVGSLLNYGILKLVHPYDNQRSVTQEDLTLAVEKLTNKTDEDLAEQGSLAEVGVSNPLLVLGYMKGLNIPQVNIVSVNNADGALTYAPYWE